MTYLWIMVGSALGGAARYWCSGFFANHFGETFPWGTILVNIFGSFIIGFFATLTGPDGRLLVSTEIRQFVMVGICGGFTTFSAFSLQTLELMQNGDNTAAALYAAASVILCVLFTWFGWWLGRL